MNRPSDGRETLVANVLLTVGYSKFLIDEKEAGPVAVALAKARCLDRETGYGKVAELHFEEWHLARAAQVLLEQAPLAKIWPCEADARAEVKRKVAAADAEEQARRDGEAALAEKEAAAFAE